MIKLNMNEIPYPPPDRVLEASKKGLTKLNRYADYKELKLLKELISEYSNVPPKNIVLSPGSDILLREIIHTFSRGRKVIMVYPSFFPTVECARYYARKFIKISLSPPEFYLNLNILFNELSEPSLIIIDNPNNPTGKILIEKKEVEKILTYKDSLLVVDEAYFEFSGVTFVSMIKEHSNIAIVRTLDKAYGLAGARIGYIIAGEDFLDAFSSFYAFLPQPSLYAGIEAMKHPEYAKNNVAKIIKERERLKIELEKLGVQVYSSSANFLLIRTNLPTLGQELKDEGILILDLSNFWLAGFARITVGTPKENDILLSKIKKILTS